MSSHISVTILYSFFFFGITAFSLLINSIFLRFVKTLGTKNQPGAVMRWGMHTKPAIGGLTFFIVFFISFSVYSVIFDSHDVFDSQRIIGFMVAATLGFLMGLTDDAYNTRPILKLIVQILCGVILVVAGSRIDIFQNEYLNVALTIFWVVGIMNSINMLDNMDGIASSVTAFIIVAALGAMVIKGDTSNVDFMLLLGILASLVGFLFYNWHPSNMYMGDTGSQFLGVVLGYVGIHYCWNIELSSEAIGIPWGGLAALLTVFLLPLADTTVVTINRLRRGQSPFVGGRDHTTHNLSYYGYTDTQVAIIFCFASLVSVLGYFVLISKVHPNNYWLIGVYFVYFLVVFLILFAITEKNARKKKNTVPEEEEISL